MSTTRRMFGTSSSFLAAFPEVEGIVVEYTERGDFPTHFEEPMKRRVLRDNEVPAEIVCRNPTCDHKPYPIESDIRAMIGSRRTSQTIDIHCKGNERLGRGRTGAGCSNHFNGQIQITYKS